MKDFCKIFVSEKHGQILVTKDTDERHQPSVSVKFIPKGLGLCGPGFSFSDEDEMKAWERVDTLFEELNLERCEELAEEVCKMTSEF